ncbi:Transcriptional regulator, TetR-family [Corynebacterium glyciniphilum AJ 3170]|uniref:Transcriptional regulator, TetR-family n=1 Tax=Corynebacterium glyciniphilum AJ 3170 TaxID=1404245 RepID=X5DQD5_9CORY|nr:TetR/AcrR family transcriptional regulator [Corynebacterium glyciniphilum]AHW63504.1 Transcriptional regulator, TetR-family [Corynebacterium glyciniphilum AJ 3170]
MAGGRRAEQQERNRHRILSAARDEFSDVGYRSTKIDAVAGRAELTRGAVYSNFVGKRALGLAVAVGVLSETADAADWAGRPAPTRQDAVSSLARGWLARLPAGGATGDSELAHLVSDLHAEIRNDRDLRDAYSQLLALDAIILGRALETLGQGETGRQVKVASSLLSLLHSAGNLSAMAPGFTDPFDVVTGCTSLAATDFSDAWTPPHASIVPPVHAEDRPWEPPTGMYDLITGSAVESWATGGDTIIAVLGLRQAAAVEQALRSADGEHVTLVLVTDDPGERAPLAEMALAELLGVLRPVVPSDALAGLTVILDRDGRCAEAVGLRAATDDTHVALRIGGGRITARAEGPAACHALTTMSDHMSDHGMSRPAR